MGKRVCVNKHLKAALAEARKSGMAALEARKAGMQEECNSGMAEVCKPRKGPDRILVERNIHWICVKPTLHALQEPHIAESVSVAAPCLPMVLIDLTETKDEHYCSELDIRSRWNHFQWERDRTKNERYETNFQIRERCAMDRNDFAELRRRQHRLAHLKDLMM